MNRGWEVNYWNTLTTGQKTAVRIKQGIVSAGIYLWLTMRKKEGCFSNEEHRSEVCISQELDISTGETQIQTSLNGSLWAAGFSESFSPVML